MEPRSFDDEVTPLITSLDTVSAAGAVVTSRSQEQVRALTMVVPELWTATHAGHDIHLDNAQLVIDSISDVVDQVRSEPSR